jgi:hypothetical protein
MRPLNNQTDLLLEVFSHPHVDTFGFVLEEAIHAIIKPLVQAARMNLPLAWCFRQIFSSARAVLNPSPRYAAS